LLSALLGLQSAWGLDPNRSIAQFIHRRWDRSSFPAGEVHALAQTTDGYLWVGAQNGLFRFDGVSFRKFDFSTSSPYPGGPVLALRADAAGGLWVLLELPGLLRFFNGVFETPTPNGNLVSGARGLGQGISGEVLVVRPRDLLRYRGGKLQPIIPGGGADGTSIAETADGVVWLGTPSRGVEMLRNGKSSPLPGLPDTKVNCIDASPQGDLWIGTDNGLAHWDGVRIVPHDAPAALAHTQILSLARDSDSNLWVGTPEGLARMDRFGNLALEPPGGRGRPVYAIFEDRERNLWVGRQDGLEEYRDTAFFAYQPATGDSARSEGPLYADSNGRTWYGPSSGGLEWVQGSARGRVLQFGNDVVYSLAGGAGEVWAGTRESGLVRVHAEGKAFVRVYNAAGGLAKGPVIALCRTRDGAVWAGTLNGGISEERDGRIVTYTTANGLASNAVTAISEAMDGTLWIATANGLQTRKDGAWQPHPNQDELPPGRINSLLWDSSGVLWVATDSGLAFASGGRIAAVRNPPTDLQGPILGFADDGRGALWIATDSHVVRAARASLLALAGSGPAPREFDTADGLPSTEGLRRDRSVVADYARRIWMSLGGGICVTDPARVPDGSAPAIVHVEGVTVDGEALKSWNDLRLSSGHRRVSFDFIALSLASPEKVRYQYRLDPLDSQWTEPAVVRQAVYANLGPGKYRFRLMASNSDGVFNSSETAVAMEVTPRLWQLLWFQVLAGLAAMAAAFALYRYRLHRLTAELNMRFEERLAERTRLAQELHDTLLQGFLSISLHVQVAANAVAADSKAKPILTRVLDLMRQVIEEGRNTVRGLRAEPQQGPALENAFSEIPAEIAPSEAGAHKPEFRMVVEGDPRPLHPLLRDEVYRIGREAILNAFRHSEASHIDAELRYSHHQLQLFVRDDGTGIDEHILQFRRDKHWGLTGMRERAERIGAKLHVMSRESAGTEIQLDVPAHLAFLDERPKRKWFADRRRLR
jgi:signal transduction histidine kinase/ligand-binding sensor domain-containing protein